MSISPSLILRRGLVAALLSALGTSFVWDNESNLTVVSAIIILAIIVATFATLEKKSDSCEADGSVKVASGSEPTQSLSTQSQTSDLTFHFPKAAPFWVGEDDLSEFKRLVARLRTGCSDGEEPSAAALQGVETLSSKLKEVRKKLDELGIATTSHLHEPLDDRTIARFLVVAHMDSARAAANMASYVNWRYNIWQPSLPPHNWREACMVRVPFADSHGRPVLVMRVRLVNPKSLTPEEFEQGFCATLDANLAHNLARRVSQGQSCKDSNPFDQYVCVIDPSGSGWSNFSMPMVKTVQRLATTRYAEIVSKIYILGPGAMAKTAWSMVRPLLQERTQRNVVLVPRDNIHSFWRGLLGDEFAERELPPDYGGKGPAWPESSATLEGQIGALAAESMRFTGLAGDKRSAASARAAGTSKDAKPIRDVTSMPKKLQVVHAREAPRGCFCGFFRRL
eukprot:TRINITY_DN25810_c1_g1_i1.p1 TRINITY_DN25810_c1_g1~~TRINITY_DN25810_c1_g1_i1.p1  ORF type:complete len:452 (-),score=47.72 TRINITY_DN25810_c1_g1_i1:457-1812(-)